MTTPESVGLTSLSVNELLNIVAVLDTENLPLDSESVLIPGVSIATSISESKSGFVRARHLLRILSSVSAFDSQSAS